METTYDKTYINQLEDELLEAKRAYYNSGSVIMSDAEYDRKEEKLKRIYPESILFKMVGSDTGAGEDVDLVYRAFSTDKALSAEEMASFFNRVSPYRNYPFVLSTKMDGVSLILFYEQGVLVNASTRGNGMVGSKCLDKVIHVPSIPNILPVEFTGQIRGELTISHANFDRFNNLLESNNEPKQANSRNSVSGLLNNKSLKSLKEKMALTSFNAFGVYDENSVSADEFGSYDLYSYQLDKARSLGFTPVEYRIFDNAESLRSFINLNYDSLGDEISSKDTRCDGVVIRLNNNTFARKLGYAAKYINAATALKFNPEYALVSLKDVEWSYGSDEITPVAIFDPVELDGAMVSRCSMHSIKNMVDLDVLKPGDTFILVKSGGIIPRSYRRDDPKFNY